MKRINILIIEDDVLLAKSIENYLRTQGYESISTTSSGERAVEIAKVNPFDLLLMDIHLNGRLDGVETAKKIQKSGNIPIVYITESDDREVFMRAKVTFPKNYITKPFSLTQLGFAIDLAFDAGGDGASLQPIHDKFVFIHHENNCYQKITVEDICFIEADGAYSKIYLAGKEKPLVVSISSNNVVKKLDSPHLKKAHKSFYINTSKVDAIENRVLKIGPHRVPVSQSLQKEVLQNFTILKREK